MPPRNPTPNIMADLLRNQPAAAIVEIPLDDIADNPFQPRQSYDQAALEELAASIQSNGLQQPPAGRRMPDGRGVQLIFGHRRKRAFDVLRAKDAAAWSSMPVMIVQASDEEMAARAWTENVEREDLTAVEQAQAIQRMVDSFGWTQADVSRRLGLAPATVANKLRLLRAPREVQEAVLVGQLSERQAAAMAPLWDLPDKARHLLLTRRDQQGAHAIRQAAINNSLSSDSIRALVATTIRNSTLGLDGQPWATIDLETTDTRLQSPTCHGCPQQVVINGEKRCADPTCHALKRQLWSDREDARLVSASGVSALPPDVSSTTVVEFWGADAQIAEAAGLATPPFCTNLRIRKTAGLGGGLRIPGVDGGKLVCLPGQGRSCRCLVAARQAATKDGKERWRHVRQQTADALTAALSNPTPDTMRLLAGFHARYDQRDQVASWRLEDCIKTIVAALIEQSKPYDVEQKPQRGEEAMAALLARAFIAPPWGIAAQLQPADPLAPLRGRLGGIDSRLQQQTLRSNMATASELEQIIDDTVAIIAKLAKLPNSDQQLENARHADKLNNSALDMLTLISDGYEIGESVSWIVNTPISDINARTALDRATRQDIIWAIAIVRLQRDNTTKLDAFQRRIRALDAAQMRADTKPRRP